MVSPSKESSASMDDLSSGYLTARSASQASASSRPSFRHGSSSMNMNMNPRLSATLHTTTPSPGYQHSTAQGMNRSSMPNHVSSSSHSVHSGQMSEKDLLHQQQLQQRDEEIRRLKEQVALAHESTSERLPTGKNSLGRQLQNATATDRANVAMVSTYVFHELWPHHKIYKFGEAWESWGSPFCQTVMAGLGNEVVIPSGFPEKLYWEKKIFPHLMKAVSDRRNNTQTRIRRVFEERYKKKDLAKLETCVDARHLGCPSGEANVVLRNFRQLVRDELSGHQGHVSSVDANELRVRRGVIIESFFEFVDKFVVCMYGPQRINALLKENREKSVIDLITPQDIAYTILMVENGYDKWIFNIRKKTDPVFDARSPPVPPYTFPKNVHIPAHDCNWTPMAQAYYEKLSNIMFRLMNNGTILWEEIQDGWESFHDTCGTSGSSRYKKRQRVNTNPNASSISSTPGFHLAFALPSSEENHYNPFSITHDGMDSWYREDDDSESKSEEEEEEEEEEDEEEKSENSGGSSVLGDSYPTDKEIDGFRKHKLLELCSAYGVSNEGKVPQLKRRLKQTFRALRSNGSIAGV